ncbi:MAG: DUF5906 domain-containing protein [Chromatiales bacterium]|nr:DUF5906 domain-containing protein [Chromatiales bacterium]
MSALIGISNTAISTLQNLETNRFETAKLHGKRLCMINESGRHGGELNMLKAITGGDHIPIERKNVQQTGSFVFEGLVLMATNEPMVSSRQPPADWNADGSRFAFRDRRHPKSARTGARVAARKASFMWRSPAWSTGHWTFRSKRSVTPSIARRSACSVKTSSACQPATA